MLITVHNKDVEQIKFPIITEPSNYRYVRVSKLKAIIYWIPGTRSDNEFTYRLFRVSDTKMVIKFNPVKKLGTLKSPREKSKTKSI